MMKRILTITALILIHFHALAYYPTVHNFTKEEYKGGAQNWAITHGAGGSMWFANSAIVEYDGNDWTRYQTVNHTSVRSLMYDADSERMYFGATNEFGYIQIGEDNSIEYVSLKDGLDTTIGDIWAIHKADDALWLRENNNIYLYDFKQLKQFSFNDKVAISAKIGEDFIIFVNNHGVMKYSPDGEFREIHGTESLARKRVNSILPFGDNLLFVTATDGVFLFDGSTLSDFDRELSWKLMQDNVYCAATDGRYLSFGTVQNGVYIKDLHEGHTIHLNTYSGLQNNTVLSMYYDDHDNLWLGLDKGIDLIELGSSVYRLFGNANEFGAGYASELFEDKLWLGTNQGLYVTDFTKGHVAYNDQKIKEVMGVKGQVWSLMKYDGHLFCCNDKGIHIIRNGRSTHIPMNGAWKLEPLRRYPDRLLGCSYDRLFLLKKSGGRWRFDGWMEGFDQASKVFVEDKDEKIWFYHWVNGLFRLTPDIENRKITETEYLSRNEGFPEDWSNTPMKVNDDIIFHTVAGFYCYDTYNRKAYRHEQLNSLFSTPPVGTSVHVTPWKDFFFSSPSMQTFCYKDEDGYVVDSLSLNHLAEKRLVGFEDIKSLSDKMILVNTEDGFSIIRTEVLKQRSIETAHEVYIKDIVITQSEGDTTVFSSRSRTRCENSHITLPYRHNSLKFTAVLPSFTSGTKARYSFMLENYDSGWSQYTDANSKEYTKLPPGRYTFRVQAKTPDSEVEEEAHIKVTILAPWYMSSWAYLLYTLIIILNGYLIFMIVRHIMNVRARQIKRQNEEEMKKRQMQLDLEHKAQDLAASTMNVIRKNEILLDIDASLERIAEYIAEDRNRSLKALSKIRHEIRENIQHDDLWKKFEENFDIVYADFLKRLGEKYPHLSVTDKKMCAYLKMDLSSKEIAPLLNITVRSVEMTRYRIRKKLGLSREDNLTEFLQKF